MKIRKPNNEPRRSFEESYKRWVSEARTFEKWIRATFIFDRKTCQTLISANNEWIANLESTIRDLGNDYTGHNQPQGSAGVPDWFELA
jgi:hypothetical protein